MPNFIARIFAQLRELFQSLSISQKISVLIAVSAVIAITMVTAIWSKKPHYQMLYSRLAGEAMSDVVASLDTKRIPYRLSADGMNISVPSDMVQEAKLFVAGEGVLMNGAAGFEIFDGQKLGMTEFMQKLNYQRAIQGELARTISQLKEVESARVHIVMPKKTLFEESSRKATASVVVKLKRGRFLSSSQTNGIVQLVANAVEAMSPANISVIDSDGNVLTKGSKGDVSQTASNNLELQHTFENKLEQKVTSMLDKVLGSDKSIVRVSAVMDFEQSEKFEEIFDPDRVVIRSEQHSVETQANSEGQPGGVPGVASNLLETSAGSSTATFRGSNTNDTINYEITRSTIKSISPSGELRRLSVAVLIDGTYETDGDGNRKYIPRSDEDLAVYTRLIRNVVGLNAERGDHLEVASVPFDSDKDVVVLDLPQPFLEKYQPYISLAKSVVGNLSVALIAILFLLLVLRPLVKWLVKPVETNLLTEGGGKTVTEMEANLLESNEKSETVLRKESIVTAAKGNTDMVQNVIKGWVEE